MTASPTTPGTHISSEKHNTEAIAKECENAVTANLQQAKAMKQQSENTVHHRSKKAVLGRYTTVTTNPENVHSVQEESHKWERKHQPRQHYHQSSSRSICHSLAQRATAHTANLVSPIILSLSLSMSMSERSPKPTERKDKILCKGNWSNESFTSTPQLQLNTTLLDMMWNDTIIQFVRHQLHFLLPSVKRT